MKIFILFFCILFCHLLIIFSCKKKNDKLTISGTAFNTEINQNVSNIKVDLYIKRVSNNTWNNQFGLLNSVYTQADGTFKFEFDNTRASDFKLTFNKTGYFTLEYIINPDLVQKGKEYNQTYFVHYESWLKLLIKNFSPADADDLLFYKLLTGAITCPNGCVDTFKYFIGPGIDTTNICRVYGSQWAVIEWNVTNGSNHIQNVDSLWIPVSDTLAYSLYY